MHSSLQHLQRLCNTPSAGVEPFSIDAAVERIRAMEYSSNELKLNLKPPWNYGAKPGVALWSSQLTETSSVSQASGGGSGLFGPLGIAARHSGNPPKLQDSLESYALVSEMFVDSTSILIHIYVSVDTIILHEHSSKLPTTCCASSHATRQMQPCHPPGSQPACPCV